MSLFDNIPEGTDIIEVRKKVNKMLSEARKKAKPPKCILCGKEQSSFCNSHSVISYLDISSGFEDILILSFSFFIVTSFKYIYSTSFMSSAFSIFLVLFYLFLNHLKLLCPLCYIL